MSSDAQSIITRHDPGRWSRTLAHRPKADLPFDPFQVPSQATLLFDATVYIDQLKGELPRSIIDLMAARTILHGAPALAELAVSIGAREPADRRTQATLTPIVEMFTRIDPGAHCCAELRNLARGGGDGRHFGTHPRHCKARAS